ncbi:MAG TPA: nucleotide-diphospho-sugar transferase [Cyclobacteriaceae bacterium]|nr:nucleotide-diphospho-sugar transferase [Cyclobacteriaceae bacterium]
MKRETPAILLIAFNRPETTQRVFEAIRKARPARLYVAADGHRPDRPDEKRRCEEVRKIITDVDWPCELKTFFRNENNGCGAQVTASIGWFFEHETEGIILEDDCLPSPSFFQYCGDLLERYRDDTRVMMIGGNNLENKEEREREYSYTFSKLTYIWGWATWRRAWKLHDFYMPLFREIDAKRYLLPVYDSIYERDLFQYVFGKMYTGDDQNTSRRNIWDYQWQFACRINSGLVIVPSVNLVSNIGFGEFATSVSSDGPGNNLKCEELDFPLIHPEFVMVDQARERRTFELCHTSRKSRLKSRIKSYVPKALLKTMKTFL